MPMDLILDFLFELLNERSKNWNTAKDLSPIIAIIVACIAGFFGSIVTFFATLYFFPYEDGVSVLSLNLLMGICLVGGAAAGGLVEGIRELRCGITSIKSVAQGVIAGVIGAAICLVVVYILALATI